MERGTSGTGEEGEMRERKEVDGKWRSEDGEREKKKKEGGIEGEKQRIKTIR